MDNGQGKFERLFGTEREVFPESDKKINPFKVFRVDEIVKIKESYFRVKEIFARTLKLRLLSDNEVEEAKFRGQLEKEKHQTDLKKFLEERAKKREEHLENLKQEIQELEVTVHGEKIELENGSEINFVGDNQEQFFDALKQYMEKKNE